MKKVALITLGLLSLAPAAFAQVSVTVGAGDYWRQPYTGQKESDWAGRETYHNSDANWEHAHCVRDWQNKEFCRR